MSNQDLFDEKDIIDKKGADSKEINEILPTGRTLIRKVGPNTIKNLDKEAIAETNVPSIYHFYQVSEDLEELGIEDDGKLYKALLLQRKSEDERFPCLILIKRAKKKSGIIVTDTVENTAKIFPEEVNFLHTQIKTVAQKKIQEAYDSKDMLKIARTIRGMEIALSVSTTKEHNKLEWLMEVLQKNQDTESNLFYVYNSIRQAVEQEGFKKFATGTPEIKQSGETIEEQINNIGRSLYLLQDVAAEITPEAKAILYFPILKAIADQDIYQRYPKPFCKYAIMTMFEGNELFFDKLKQLGLDLTDMIKIQNDVDKRQEIEFDEDNRIKFHNR